MSPAMRGIRLRPAPSRPHHKRKWLGETCTPHRLYRPTRPRFFRACRPAPVVLRFPRPIPESCFRPFSLARCQWVSDLSIRSDTREWTGAEAHRGPLFMADPLRITKHSTRSSRAAPRHTCDFQPPSSFHLYPEPYNRTQTSERPWKATLTRRRHPLIRRSGSSRCGFREA